MKTRNHHRRRAASGVPPERKSLSMKERTIIIIIALLVMLTVPVLAQEQPASEAANSGQELAKKLSNPIASLISVPLQFNYDQGYGPNDGKRYVLNIQPVIPKPISKNWNVISRTILPVVYQSDIAGSSGAQFGLGDVVQSIFFSPSKPTKSGLIWGAGPVFLLPTGTDALLSARQWGTGPTFVVLKQAKGQTVGLLANHIWSVAGPDSRPDVSSTFVQPFYSFTTPKLVTYGLNTESTYNWQTNEWSVPINATVSKLTKFGKQLVSIGGGVRYWAKSPDGGPDGWGLRLSITYLFPTK